MPCLGDLHHITAKSFVPNEDFRVDQQGMKIDRHRVSRPKLSFFAVEARGEFQLQHIVWRFSRALVRARIVHAFGQKLCRIEHLHIIGLHKRNPVGRFGTGSDGTSFIDVRPVTSLSQQTVQNLF